MYFLIEWSPQSREVGVTPDEKTKTQKKHVMTSSGCHWLKSVYFHMVSAVRETQSKQYVKLLADAFMYLLCRCHFTIIYPSARNYNPLSITRYITAGNVQSQYILPEIYTHNHPAPPKKHLIKKKEKPNLEKLKE